MDFFQIVETISDADKWPGFRAPERLEELDDIANEAFARNTFEGNLAYVFITHQISDDMLRLLIRHVRFELRLMLATSERTIRFSSKADDSDLDKMMTGQLIAALKMSLDFDGKEEFIGLCEEMSDIRNKLAHQLAERAKLTDLRDTTTKYRAKAQRAEALCLEMNDTFRLGYKDHRKDDGWDEQLEQMLDEEPEISHDEGFKRALAARKAAGFGFTK